MASNLWFSTGGERVRAALEAALSWCEQCVVVSEAPGSGHDDDFWQQLARLGHRARGVVVSNLESADPELLRALQRSGVLRRFADGAVVRGHCAWFERGEELRFVLAPGALSSAAPAGQGLWLFWEGPRAALPDGLGAVLEQCWTASVPAADDLETASAGARRGPVAYSRAIPSVCEVLGIRSRRDWLELEPEDQERALWSALIGEGPVDLEQAIRLCAERLRAQGFLAYQALRQDGRVYQAIEERLLAARRRTDLFDRPRNGFVRAVQCNLDDLTAEQWRDCLMGGLEEGVRVDRDQAVRLGFEQAQAVYGVNVQRLRSGGRADHALRSAINSCVRQGYLQRDGAAYLVRVAKTAEPTLRGVVVVAEPTEEALPATTEAVAVVEPAPASSPDAPPTLPPPPSTRAPVPPLDRPLHELDFPARTANWAENQGIRTVRELVAWQPEEFARERNIGRRTVRETRELLEAHLGCTWEAARAALRAGAEPGADLADAREEQDEAVDSATEALTAGGREGWARLAGELTDEQRAVPLADVVLPTRMKNFVRDEGLQVLGDLFRYTHDELGARPNLGRKSLNDTLDAVRDHLSERLSPPVYATFREAWQAQLTTLEPIPRMIVTRRAGMLGASETLEELGVMLGVTRERVRQIEMRVIERLRERSRWRREVEAKLGEAFGPARAVPLGLLAQDPWWAGIDQQELLLDYVVRRVLGDELFLVRGPGGKRYLAKFSQEQFDERLERAKVRLAKLEYPVELEVVTSILHSEADPLDPVMLAEFEQAVGERIHVDPERPELVLGHGRRREDEIIAFLNGQPEPVPVGVIEELFERGRLPEDILYFKRGVVGLKRHFPDFDGWMERLVPPALEVMNERPEGRQWLIPEIHDALRERGAVPEWLGHWHLASLLRLSGQVAYLGRLRVAAHGSGQEQRLQYEELLEQILEESGGPLELSELLARARRQTDINEATAGMMVRQAPFVKLDERRIGLVERDIPGGPEAVAVAVEAVLRELSEKQHGLTPHQATVIVQAVSDVHRTWSKQLVTSVLRNEPNIRIDRSKNIGLDEWDDARCPTRPEFVHREVLKAGDAMPVSELCARLEAFYGRAPDRAQLYALAVQAGLSLAGDTIRQAPAVQEAPPPSRGPINLAGIPAELRELFEELMSEPLSDTAELRRQIDQHVEEIEREYRVNEFVDVEGARLLGRQCHALLARWESLPPADRQLVNASVRYFVSWHDLEHDLDIGGLDDDKQIVKAVLDHLGIQEQGDGRFAS